MAELAIGDLSKFKPAPKPETPAKPITGSQVLEGRANGQEPVPKDTSVEAFGSILFDVTPKNSQLVALGEAVAKTEGVQAKYVLSSREKVPTAPEVTGELKTNLLSFTSASTHEKKLEAMQKILTSTHEANWRGNLREVLTGLGDQEQGLILELTRQNTVRNLADMLVADKKGFTEGYYLGKREWGLHKNILSVVAEAQYVQQNPKSSPAERENFVKGVLKRETTSLAFQTLADVIKDHANMVGPLWSSFTKHVLPLLTKTP